MPPKASQSTPTRPVPWQIKAFSVIYPTGKILPKNIMEYASYDPETREFTLVADAYRFALDLFRRGDAIANRLTLGRRCVRAWNDPALATTYKNYKWLGDVDKMADYEKQYREAVQASPPRVHVENIDAYAETMRLATAKWDLQHFNPRTTFQIKLDSAMLKALVANDRDLFRPQRFKEGETDAQYNAFVKKQDHEFQELRFLLAATFFHELHHGFVAYLAGNNSIFTPTTASYMPSASDSDQGMGESGSFAERNVLGGIVIMDPPPPSNQIGALQIITEEKVYRIGYACLKTIKTDPHTVKLKALLKQAGGKPHPDTAPGSQPSAGGTSAKYYRVYGKHGSQIVPSVHRDQVAATITKGFPVYNLNLEFEGTQLRPKVLLFQEVKVTA